MLAADPIAAPAPSTTRPAVVYAAREFEVLTQPGARLAPIERAKRGRLMLLDPDGSTRELIRPEAAAVGLPADVSDPSVSFDGSRVVFAGFVPAEDAWRIFEVGADGAELRQLTHSDRRLDLSRYGEAAEYFADYDDTDPCYLPDGRICFVSTRYPGLAPAGRVRTTNLYVMRADGGGLHRITTERFGGDTPAVDPVTGKIVYSRWWLTVPAELPTPDPLLVVDPDFDPTVAPYYGPPPPPPLVQALASGMIAGIADADFAGVNSWFLAETAPDGTGHAMFTGYGMDRDLTMAWRPSFTRDGEVLALFLTLPPFLGYPGEHGLRKTRRGPVLPQALGGPQSFDGSAVLPDPDRTAAAPAFRAPAFLYHSAEPLADGTVLVTGCRPGIDDIAEEGEEGPADYGIFLQRDGEAPELIFSAAGTLELDAVALEARARPPVLPPSVPPPESDDIPATVNGARAQHGTFRFVVENIFANAPIDVPNASAPPVSENLRIEFYMNPQRDGTDKPRAPILIESQPVPLSGHVEAELPAGVPLFEVLRLPSSEIGLGRDGQVFHVGGMNFGAAGTVARCVGCHAGHSQIPVPAQRWPVNLAPSAEVSVSSTAKEIAGEPVESEFDPMVLIDRKRDRSSEWVADHRDGAARVELRWPMPVIAGEVVVYGVKLGPGLHRLRDLRLTAFRVETYLGATQSQAVQVEQTISHEGTAVALHRSHAFDRLVVTIRRQDIEGRFEGVVQAALAEIEVIGQPAGAEAVAAKRFLVRGDTDCDQRFSVSDPVEVLGHLFLGGTLCCEEAADANADARLDPLDPLHLIDWLFTGGQPPADPWPDCGEVAPTRFSCAQETCPGGP